MAMRRGRRATSGFLKDFQEFALKGNVLDLAVAVIIGGAFGSIISSLVEDVIMPLVNVFVATEGGNWREITVGPGIMLGSFIGAVVDFIIIALILFLIVRTLLNLKKKEEATPPPPSERDCPYCLTRVPIAATRCSACTSELPAIEG